jgi:hypothetical protein
MSQRIYSARRPFHRCRIGGGDHGGGQEGHDAFVEPFPGSPDTLDEQGVLGVTSAAKENWDRIAVSRSLRVRTLLCQSDSRWFRNVEIVMTPRSSSRAGWAVSPPLVHEDLWRRCYFPERVVPPDPAGAPDGFAVPPVAPEPPAPLVPPDAPAEPDPEGEGGGGG